MHRFELTSGRISPSHNGTVRKENDRILAAGIITPVESPRTSPVVIATKKNRSPLFCVEYRKLNSVMLVDCWPLPRVNKILDDMRSSSVFTTIDLFQGYWQIKMDETCKEKAVFICRYEKFQSVVMPFGQMNSQATFRRMMDRILLNVANVRCYIDDVVIFSKNTEEHASHLENVFAILKNNGLR